MVQEALFISFTFMILLSRSPGGNENSELYCVCKRYLSLITFPWLLPNLSSITLLRKNVHKETGLQSSMKSIVRVNL